jgi:peptidoglycan hydrolase FlgJ
MRIASSNFANGANAPADAERTKLVRVAEQFEALFVAQMFKSMRQAASAFGDSTNNESAALMDQAYWLVSDDIARQHAFGIADCLIAQMSPPRSTSSLPPPDRDPPP